MNKINTGNIIICSYITLWIIFMIAVGYIPNIDNAIIMKMAPATLIFRGMVTLAMLTLSPWILNYKWEEQKSKRRKK